MNSHFVDQFLLPTCFKRRPYSHASCNIWLILGEKKKIINFKKKLYFPRMCSFGRSFLLPSSLTLIDLEDNGIAAFEDIGALEELPK